MLVDTSVWIAHLRRGNAKLVTHLEAGDVECHPYVIGELACANLSQRREILALLSSLPQVTEADHDEVLDLAERHRLDGRGLGWIDLHLLASSLLETTTLWTLDRRLADQARTLAVVFERD